MSKIANAQTVSERQMPDISADVGYTYIPITEITVGDNVRKDFGDLTDLIASVKLHGVLEPVIVQALESGGYLLLAGGRRYEAAKEADLGEIPAVLLSPALSLAEQQEIQFIENFHRKDLNPYEEAISIKNMVDTGMKQKDIADRLSVSQPYVANRLRLLDFDNEKMIEFMIEGKITPSHIIEIMKFKKLVPDLIYREMVDFAISTMESLDYDVTVSRIGDYGFYLCQFSDSDPDDDSWLTIHHNLYDDCKNCKSLLRLGYSTICKDSVCYNRIKRGYESDRIKEKISEIKNSGNVETEYQDIVKSKLKEEKVNLFTKLVSDSIQLSLDDGYFPPGLIRSCFADLARKQSYRFSSRHKEYFDSVVHSNFTVDHLKSYLDSQVLQIFLYQILMDKIVFVRSDKDRDEVVSYLMEKGIYLSSFITEFDFSVPEEVDVSLPVCPFRKAVDEYDDVFHCESLDHQVLYKECLMCGGKSEKSKEEV